MPKNPADLTLKDIKFLRAVRELCDNPENYPNTDLGDAPANTTALKNDLPNYEPSKGVLNYRMVKDNESDGNKRGLEVDGGLGYIRIHSPSLTEDGYGPRSVEITDKGRRALESAEERSGMEDTVARETDGPSSTELQLEVERLGDRVDELEAEREELVNQLEEVRELMELWQERDIGATSRERADKINSAINAVPTFYNTFSEVFGVDSHDFNPKSEITPQDVEDARAAASERLSDNPGE